MFVRLMVRTVFIVSVNFLLLAANIAGLVCINPIWLERCDKLLAATVASGLRNNESGGVHDFLGLLRHKIIQD